MSARGRRWAAVLLPLFFLGLASPAPEPRRWALIIGINDYENYGPDDGDLRAAENDALAVRDVLVARWGLPEENARVLLSRAATREAIRSAFLDWAVSNLGPEDHFIFFYAGHGSQVLDDDGDEEDGLDETICPTDVLRGSSRMDIRDDELREWLEALPTTNVLVILDSCNSGTATRLARQLTPRFLPRDAPEGIVSTRGDAAEAAVDDQITDAPDGILEIAAAAPGQSALEASFGHADPDGPHRSGVFTHYFVELLWQAPPTATYEQLFRRAVHRMRAGHFTQDPQFTGPTGAIVLGGAYDAALAGTPGAPAAPAAGAGAPPDEAQPPPDAVPDAGPPVAVAAPGGIRVSSVGDGTAELTGGARAGLTVGSVYRTDGGAVVRIAQVHESRAIAEILEGAVAVGEGVRQVEVSFSRPDLRVSVVELPAVLRRGVEELLGAEEAFRVVDPATTTPDVFLVGDPDEGVLLVLGRDEARRAEIPVRFPTTETVAEVGRQLRRELALKRVAALENPAPAFQVEVLLSGGRDRFGFGEEITFEVETEVGGHLTLVDLGMDGGITVLYPNPWDPSRPIAAGTRVRIAPESEFRILPIAGSGLVRAFVTPSPLDLTIPEGELLSSDDALTLVDDLGRSLALAAFRGVDDDGDGSAGWATDLVVYEVHP